MIDKTGEQVQCQHKIVKEVGDSSIYFFFTFIIIIILFIHYFHSKQITEILN